ncbi:MAG: hypothetical protein HC842_00840 [Cytophagales bacterium]|nr:hypothetical protein [Cytophagales bacterium]
MANTGFDSEEENKKKGASDEFDDDDFGLPGLEDTESKDDDAVDYEYEYKEDEAALEPEADFEEASPTSAPKPDLVFEEKRSNTAGLVVMVVLLVVIVVVAVYYLWIKGAENRPEPVVMEELPIDTTLVEEPEPEPEPVTVEETQTGALQVLNTNTGRYYVVVSSSIDGDMAMDYAKKLSAEGKNTYVIEPYGKNKIFPRVC